jgi:hypothetical protein
VEEPKGTPNFQRAIVDEIKLSQGVMVAFEQLQFVENQLQIWIHGVVGSLERCEVVSCQL